MKPAAISIGLLAALASLASCSQSKEARLAEACTKSPIYIMAPSDGGAGLKEACSCMAKAAVAQLDSKTVDQMITLYEGGFQILADKTFDMNDFLLRTAAFETSNDQCMAPLAVRQL